MHFMNFIGLKKDIPSNYPMANGGDFDRLFRTIYYYLSGVMDSNRTKVTTLSPEWTFRSKMRNRNFPPSSLVQIGDGLEPDGYAELILG